MQKLVVILFLVLVACSAQAQMFQTVNEDEATLLQEGPGRLYCPNCGMHLVKFYRTGHALQHTDGHWSQFCSLHCLVEAHAQEMEQARVVDVTGLSFIPVGEAFYVVGSGVKGTMTMQSKYAFAREEDARAFQAEHGGEIMTFAQAARLAAQGLDRENEMIAGKRAKMARKGRGIFEKMCAPQDLPAFKTIAEAKTYLLAKNACGKLKDDQLQAVAIYLVLGASEQAAAAPVQVPEKAKCPVCGMFVAKYPKWAAVIEAGPEHRFYFDGVKDLMKFYFQPDRFKSPVARTEFSRILVTDYYTLAALDARRAWYVVGSNVYGPMGAELIPFATEKAARTFQEDHAGVQVLRFADIEPDLVRGLDR